MELFDYLAGLVTEHRLAWDVGTGNGQAALGLAKHFDRVIATDASEAQLSYATPHERVSYHVATSEAAGLEVGLADASVDLVTVAQALHWFKFDEFYANVSRTLKPDGVMAAWSYGMNYVNPAVDKAVDRLYDITGPYWADGRKWIDEKYQTIPFPFERISIEPKPSDSTHVADVVPRDRATMFECRQNWTLAQFVGYLHSWSGTQQFMNVKGYDPLNDVAVDLSAAWGNPETPQIVHWPIYLLAGRRCAASN